MEEPIDILSSDREHPDPSSGSVKAQLSALHNSSPLCSNPHGRACRCKKDNPHCLAGTIPGPTGYRKKGLWQRDIKALVGGGGRDPCEDERQDDAIPSGLNNLGNTCYVNGALQCLFMTTEFRKGLYAVEPPVADNEVISHIRNLFAAMQASEKASADPSAFAASLMLDRTVQQDGQEFFKLLLSHLESKLKSSSCQELVTLVAKLFRGVYVFKTTCLACQQLSNSSTRETSFYELDLQVKGFAALEDSLSALQSAELLEGDNQFFCCHCNKLVDATRQLCLKSLPPLLCLSLQRFVFDVKKMTKVKAADKMSFPLMLDMESLVSQHGNSALQCPGQYELAAILIHKGPSASHGHYVAHVKEEGSEKWWRFDDETVTLLPNGPMGCSADLGVAAEKKAQPGGKAKRGRPAKVAKEESNSSDKPQDGGPAPEPDRIIASNAYMLLYRPKKPVNGTAQAAQTVELPESLACKVAAANAEFRTKCREYKEQKEKLLEQIRGRQQRVRDIIESAPLQSHKQDFRFVSASWLRKWADATDALPIDDSDILCSHGRVDPLKIKEAKKVSVAAWEGMRADSGGEGPGLVEQDICCECLAARLQDAQSREASKEMRAAVMGMLEEAEEGDAHLSDGFYISKPWLTGWKKRASQTVSLTSPTEGITCPHGGLIPEAVGAKAKRAAVPRQAWEFFEDLWVRTQAEHRAGAKRKAQEVADQAVAKRMAREADREVIVLEDGWQQLPADVLQAEDQSPNGAAHNGAASTSASAASDEWTMMKAAEAEEEETVSILGFPVGAAECKECIKNLLHGAAAGEDLKEHLQQQKLQFHMLHQATASYLDPGRHYCLLPRAWMKQWRTYLSNGHRRDADVGPPRPLDQALDDLLCTCHRTTEARLAFPPPDVSKKCARRMLSGRGKWVAEPDSMFEVVLKCEAKPLLEHYASKSGDDVALPYVPDARHPRMLLARLEVAKAEIGPPAPRGPPQRGDAAMEEEALSDTEMDVESGSGEGWNANGEEDEEEGGPGRVVKTRAAASREEMGFLVSTPEVCGQAVEDRKMRSLAVALNYTDAEITVELVHKDNLRDPPSDRRSRRSRRGRVTVRVSADTTLQALQKQIAQELGVHPLNAMVHICRSDSVWHQLESKDANMKELEVLPESELRVVSSGEHDDTDVASFVEFSDKPAVSAKERGFAGTVLAGQTS